MSTADHIPHQIPSSGPPQQQQQPQPSQQQQITTAVVAPAQSGVSDHLQCQWAGCGDRATNPEQLYEHVCERHVGRKSTNNLNLTCQWGNCHTTTVKRDHITSHIRVHVPLKPHKCDFCGKSFKRPQDLKKHVKTHADESVILRSPEPVGTTRHHQNAAYGMNTGNQQRQPSFYGENPLQSNVPMGYNYQNPGAAQGYYAPTQQQSPSAYGPVYYNVNNAAEVTHSASFDNRKRGFDVLNDFFGDVKRRNFDPTSYSDVGSRLQAFQGVQLPGLINGGGMVEYQAAPAMMNAQGGGGIYGPAPSHGYVLPPMPSLRTKNDLTSVDQILEQMTATAYESPSFIAAAGVAQPGAVLVQSGMSLRQSNSPPGVQLPSSHHSAHRPQSLSIQSNHGGGTPTLTPDSSAMSFMSENSPTSATSRGDNRVSPLNSSASMYPSLPTTTAVQVNGEYLRTCSDMTPTSTLGTQFDQDLKRRHSGGTLQKAQPAPKHMVVKQEDEMDTANDGKANSTSLTPKMASPSMPDSNGTMMDIFANEQKHILVESDGRTARHMIDPALSGLSPSSLSSDELKTEDVSGIVNEAWVDNIRLLEALREFVRGRLQREEYEGGAGSEKEEGMVVVMEEKKMRLDDEEVDGMAGLYPVLREVEGVS